MTALIIIGCVVVLVLIFYVAIVNVAPEGYEDESGFHYGTKQ